MRNVEVLNNRITEGKAIELIFDGCRDNEAREPKAVGDGYEVTFVELLKGLHQAILRNPDYVPVAMATVDQHDC